MNKATAAAAFIDRGHATGEGCVRYGSKKTLAMRNKTTCMGSARYNKAGVGYAVVPSSLQARRCWSFRRQLASEQGASGRLALGPSLDAMRN